MNTNEIEAQLIVLPIEASIAFAIRVGLRVLPWLAFSKTEQVLMRWSESVRAKHTLASLQAYDFGLLFVHKKEVTGLQQAANFRRSAAYEAAFDADLTFMKHCSAPDNERQCADVPSRRSRGRDTF